MYVCIHIHIYIHVSVSVCVHISIYSWETCILNISIFCYSLIISVFFSFFWPLKHLHFLELLLLMMTFFPLLACSLLRLKRLIKRVYSLAQDIQVRCFLLYKMSVFLLYTLSVFLLYMSVFLLYTLGVFLLYSLSVFLLYKQWVYSCYIHSRVYLVELLLSDQDVLLSSLFAVWDSKDW